MSKDRQLGFTDVERSMMKRETKRERFLSMMEEVVPWEELEELLQPFYGKQDRTVGRLLIRWGCCCAFTCSSGTLSAMGEWRGSELMCRWCVLAGMDLLEGSVPDESTILALEQFLNSIYWRRKSWQRKSSRW